MQVYRSMVAYDRWANRKVFALCLDLDATGLTAEAKGAVRTIETTLKHTVRVADAFHALLRGRIPDEALGPWPEYRAHDLVWFADRADEVAGLYDELLGEVEEASFDAELKVPWFEHPITRRDAFVQAMTHAIQHRAQVCSVLGERGVDVPNMDYVAMRQERRG
jgi:uncharacterized damage-inducible protein DinB